MVASPLPRETLSLINLRHQLPNCRKVIKILQRLRRQVMIGFKNDREI